MKLARPGFDPAAELPTLSPARRRHGGCSSPLGSSNVIGGNRRAASTSARGTGRTAYTKAVGQTRSVVSNNATGVGPCRGELLDLRFSRSAALQRVTICMMAGMASRGTNLGSGAVGILLVIAALHAHPVVAGVRPERIAMDRCVSEGRPPCDCLLVEMEIGETEERELRQLIAQARARETHGRGRRPNVMEE